MRKLINSFWTSAVLLGSSSVPVFAQNINIGGAKPAGLRDFTIPDLAVAAVRLLFIAAAVIFFIWLLLGGIQWMLSGGDKVKTEAARNQITAALIGLVVVFSAWAIAQLLQQLFGVNILNLQVTPIGSQPTQ